MGGVAMQWFMMSMWRMTSLLAAVMLFAVVSAFAQPTMALKGKGKIDFTPGKISPFHLEGTDARLGNYTCRGEIKFAPIERQGTLNGVGIAVIETTRGNEIVADVTWQIEPNGAGNIAFVWRDSVNFNDGKKALTTGRFIKARPPRAVSRTTTTPTLVL